MAETCKACGQLIPDEKEEREKITWQLVNSKRFKVDQDGNLHIGGKRVLYYDLNRQEMLIMTEYFRDLIHYRD